MTLDTSLLRQHPYRLVVSLHAKVALLVIVLFSSTLHSEAQTTRTPPEEALKSRARMTRQSAEELDRFGFDKDVDKLSERQKKQLERYRQRQRAIGFERSGRPVDVSAGYEAAAENSPHR